MLHYVALRTVAYSRSAKPILLANREVCNEATGCFLVARRFRRRLGVRCYPGVGLQNERQVLHVVRWRALLQVQDGHAAGVNAPNMQRLCGIVHSSLQLTAGQVPDVPGREIAVLENGRSGRSLQRQAIRRTAKDVVSRHRVDPDVVLDFVSPAALPCRSSQAASSNSSPA
jgi:hypothetical protein